MNKKSIYIIASALILSLSVTIVDAIIKPNYFLKIPIKIIFFLAIPLIYFLINKEETKAFKKLFTFKKNQLLKSILLGILIYVIIIVGYHITKNIIDYSNVTTNLTNSMDITANNFIYVSLYISLLNSFLEEFFFRGFSFITLKKHTSKTFAHIFSSTIFAVYHIGMLLGSFALPAIIFLLISLIIAGLILNYLNEQSDNIYPSWLVHMFANFAINTIGFILFGLI